MASLRLVEGYSSNSLGAMVYRADQAIAIGQMERQIQYCAEMAEVRDFAPTGLTRFDVSSSACWVDLSCGSMAKHRPFHAAFMLHGLAGTHREHTESQSFQRIDR